MSKPLFRCPILLGFTLLVTCALPLHARELLAQEKLQQKEGASTAGSVSRTDADGTRMGTKNPMLTPEQKQDLVKVAKDNKTSANEERLREMLREYAERFPGLIGAVGVTLRNEPGDFKEKRNAAIWQYASVSNISSITAQPNPRVALIDLVTYTTRAKNYISGPAGKEFLGTYQSLYAEVMDTADKWAWWLADNALDDKNYDMLHQEIVQWCDENPMTYFMGRENIGVLAGDRFVTPPSEKLSSSIFFSGIEDGLDNTLSELQQANRTLQNFYSLMEWMPVYVYWTGEIALYNMLESEGGQSFLSVLNGMDETQLRLNQTAEYFSTLNDFFQPFSEEIKKPEYQDAPAKLFALIEEASDMSERLDRLEQNLNTLLTDSGGEPLSERLASIDESIENLSSAAEMLQKLEPVIDDIEQPEAVVSNIEGMILRLIIVFFVCLFLSQIAAAWLVEKIRKKTK
ncbi:hypothetical protein [Ruficoccus sp. ZRK36]|uniref:hypothetical protein n=1 Tax=Ruficoccus sp. ZRK36 TaxID=2866311 RepID=UPI001C7381CD|nr:hypothetical protein [Ruficoccus sp. ZRK36]QYY36068.1 hypothetical protein K0V07_01040 [Ruficoccus sp. ZRK36]